MTIQVVLADDDPLIRVGLRTIIDHEPDLRVVGEAADGNEVIEVVSEVRPDVVLMDIRMPNRDGLDATKELIRRFDSPPRVVILTTFELDEYVYEALRAGATGFLLKRVAPTELLDAIRLAVTGESLIFPALTRDLLQHAYEPAQRPDRRLDSLTDRERQVLYLMAQGRSNQEIADSLFIGTETVKTHVGNTLAKLGARDRIQAVIYAYETGFVNTEPDANERR
jgi:DNA-binding NarL/FixJ family response regulator